MVVVVVVAVVDVGDVGESSDSRLGVVDDDLELLNGPNVFIFGPDSEMSCCEDDEAFGEMML